MRSFNYTIIQENDTIYVNLKGKIDTTTLNEFKKTLNYIKSLGEKFIVLNYSDVDYVSSAGFGSLLQFCVYSKREGLNVKVTGMREEIKNIFDIMELYRFIEYDDKIQIPSETEEKQQKYELPDYLEEWIESKVIDDPTLSIEEYHNVFLKEKKQNIPLDTFKKIFEKKGLLTKEERLFFAYKKLKEKFERKE